MEGGVHLNRELGKGSGVYMGRKDIVDAEIILWIGMRRG